MNSPRVELKCTTSGQGAEWIGTGFRLFGRAPGTWIGIIVVYAVLAVLVHFVPGGSILSALFGPVLSGGLMLGCAALDKGDELRLEHLFSGFNSGYLGSLLMIGVLVMVGSFIIVIICAAIFFGSLLSGEWHTLLPQLQQLQTQPGLSTVAYSHFSISTFSTHFSGLGIVLAIVLWLLLMIPLLMASWFAPALVVLGRQDGLAAMKLSFLASLRHFGAFLVYGILVLLLAILASIPAFLGWLVIGPVLTASLYAAYRDLFRIQQVDPPPPPEPAAPDDPSGFR